MKETHNDDRGDDKESVATWTKQEQIPDIPQSDGRVLRSSTGTSRGTGSNQSSTAELGAVPTGHDTHPRMGSSTSTDTTNSGLHCQRIDNAEPLPTTTHPPWSCLGCNGRVKTSGKYTLKWEPFTCCNLPLVAAIVVSKRQPKMSHM